MGKVYWYVFWIYYMHILHLLLNLKNLRKTFPRIHAREYIILIERAEIIIFKKKSNTTYNK